MTTRWRVLGNRVQRELAETLPFARLMAFIVLWEHVGRKCFLVIGGDADQYVVRLVDHHMGVLRAQPATDPDHALRLATIWHELETRGAFGSSDPSADVVPAA